LYGSGAALISFWPVLTGEQTVRPGIAISREPPAGAAVSGPGRAAPVVDRTAPRLASVPGFARGPWGRTDPVGEGPADAATGRVGPAL
jgi:hypothetical protein